MSSPMFDGQYRSKPLISLRGASTKVVRGGLLEKAQKDRASRETLRRQKLAALTIQASYRSYTVRKGVYASLRDDFDKLCERCSTASDVLTLSRHAMLFYGKHNDSDLDRLIKLCQRWIQFRSALSSLTFAPSSPTFLHLSTLLTWSCDALSVPSLNPTLLLRTMEVYLDPATYQHDHAPTMITRLCNHLIKSHFFSSLLYLLQLKTPPPEDASATPPPLADSLLVYLTRPLLSGCENEGMYESLANEVLSFSLSPHVSYYILPHLKKLKINLSLFISSILAGVTNGGVAPSLPLLYSTLELVHSRLPDLDVGLHESYLELVSVLLSSHTPSGHVTVEKEDDDEEEEDMEVEGEEDPLSGPEAMLRHCLGTVGGKEVASALQKHRSLSLPVMRGVCGVCYQLIRHHHILPYTKTHLLPSLALKPHLLSQLWTYLTQMSIQRSFGKGDPVLCLQQLARGLSLPHLQGVELVTVLSTYSVLFSLYLSTLHDAEFYREREVPVGSQIPFSLNQLAVMATVLRDVFINLHMEKYLPPSHSFSRLPTGHTPSRPHPEEWSRLKLLLLEVLTALYQRDCRRPFCPEGHWVAGGLSTSTIPPELFMPHQDEGEGGEVVSAPPHVLKYAELLKTAAFVFPFIERVRFFRTLITHDRTSVQGRFQDFLMGPSLSLTIRRDHVYEDAFAELARDADLRKKLRVQFVNSQGLNEPGIDGGGVFREFLSEVLVTGFDPNRGYFSTTPDGQLYPNPQSHLINEDFDLHYRFLGSMLGKSLYEGQLVELPFAGFFLCKLAAPRQGYVDTHHLASFDPHLYRNLLSLKYYDGDIEDMSLNFTMAAEELGQSKVFELKRGGSEVGVTKDNCVEYIHRMANYRLNVQLHRQFQAFRSGLRSVIPSHWLGLFNQDELQVLISGAQVPISVDDLRKHTAYAGEYKAEHDSIALFWEVVSSFTEQQKRQLLKFVTSCSRPPLLGFKELHPPFRISPGVGDSHLPSASTCMNLLKLPMFKDKQTMRDKLLYAIQSGAGFELS